MDRSAFAGAVLLVLVAGCVQPDAGAPSQAAAPPQAAAAPTFQVSWSPGDPRIDETISFGVHATDPRDPVADASWSFGDGTGLRGLAPEKAYDGAGTYEVSVTVATRSGHQTTLRQDVEVAMPPSGPAAAPEKDTDEPPESHEKDDGPRETNATDEGAAPEVFEPVMDILLHEQYVVTPAPVAVPTMSYSFQVAREYDTLEMTGFYAFSVLAYAAMPTVDVFAPDGTRIMHYTSLDVLAVATGTGGSSTSMPMGYHYDPVPGTYTVEVSGASSHPLDITLTAYKHWAPDFDYRELDSGLVELMSGHRGDILIIDLMADWCGPCHNAMPDIKAIYDDYAGAVNVLSVDIDETGETESDLQRFRSEHGAEWTFGFEIDNSASRHYGTGWIPSFAVVDQNGGLLYRHIGAMDPQMVRGIIDYALENR